MCEVVPGCWLRTRVSSTFLQVTAQIWLVATLVSIIPTDLYCRVSIMIYGAPQSLYSQPVISVSCNLDRTGGEIDELRLQLFGAVAGYWQDKWSTTPTADAAFLSASAGPSCHFGLQVCCLQSSPISYAWYQGGVQRAVAQLVCQLLGCTMQGKLEAECWL